jgi:hypothetical protein
VGLAALSGTILKKAIAKFYVFIKTLRNNKQTLIPNS